MTYNDANAHPRDRYLTFQAADHTYTLSPDGRRLRPVSEVVAGLFKPFDADYWSRLKAPSMGLSPQELRRRWEDKGRQARDQGTAMHAAIERYYLRGGVHPQPGDADDPGDAYALFRAFTAHVTLHPYRTEWSIYDEDSGVAGTLDMLDRDPRDGTFNLYDWKRSARLMDASGEVVADSPYGQRGLGAASRVPDVPFWHYALQLGIYRRILQLRYGIRVTAMRLGVFHPSLRRPQILEVPYLAAEVSTALATRHPQV